MLMSEIRWDLWIMLFFSPKYIDVLKKWKGFNVYFTLHIELVGKACLQVQ